MDNFDKLLYHLKSPRQFLTFIIRREKSRSGSFFIEMLGMTIGLGLNHNTFIVMMFSQ